MHHLDPELWCTESLIKFAHKPSLRRATFHAHHRLTCCDGNNLTLYGDRVFDALAIKHPKSTPEQIFNYIKKREFMGESFQLEQEAGTSNVPKPKAQAPQASKIPKPK